MAEKQIIYMNDKGWLAIVIPAYKDRRRPAGETEAGRLGRAIARAVPAGATYWIVDNDVFPPDKTFRHAWVENGGLPVVDMPKARAIHLSLIRQVRDQELANLDGPSMHAMESGDQVAAAEIAQQKQTLRDIPQTFDLAKFRSPGTLKAAWPAQLPIADG